MSFYDDASLIVYPSGYKEDKIYSLKPTNGTGDLNFSRASSATRVNEQGLIETPSIIGSEEVTNGDFATDTDWTKEGSWAISSGMATVTGGGANPALIQSPIGTVGNIHIISFEVKANTLVGTGEVFDLPYVTPYTSFTVAQLTVGVHTFQGTIISANAFRLRLLAAATAGSLSIDNVSVKEVITSNIPRIDYTNGCGSLLLEKQSTNLITYSESFDNAAWVKQTATITANAAISPDGTTNADLYTTSTDLYDFVRHSITYISGTSYTISVFVKQGTSSEISVFLPSQAFGSNQAVIFDVSDGTYTITSGSPSVTIEDYGNGWYRCAVSATATITATRNTGFSSVASGAVTTLYLYGAQVEGSSYPTSYIISNSGTSTTRIADAASKTGISSLIGQTEGTIFINFDKDYAEVSERYLAIGDGTTSNRIMIIGGTGGSIRGFISNGGAIQFDNSTGSAVGNHKIALAYAANDIAFYVDGVQIALDTSATIPAVGNFYLGTHEAGFTERLNGSANQAILFKTRLDNDELADLTGAVHQTFNSLATFYNYTIL